LPLFVKGLIFLNCEIWGRKRGDGNKGLTEEGGYVNYTAERGQMGLMNLYLYYYVGENRSLWASL